MSETARKFWDAGYSKENKIELPEDISRAAERAKQFFGSLNGKRILDVGCGHGGTSLFFANLGADVTAIDFSAAAIENLKQVAAYNEVSNIHAVVGDAMKIDQLGKFDYVFGSLVLHHLEPFSDFCNVLRSTLKEGGSAFFYENNAASELLIWFRRNVVGKLWVPRYGDDDEFPLMPSEVAMLRRHFQVDIEIPEMIFTQLVSAYLLKRRLSGLTRKIDALLFKYNLGTRYSYRQYVKVRERTA